MSYVRKQGMVSDTPSAATKSKVIAMCAVLVAISCAATARKSTIDFISLAGSLNWLSRGSLTSA